MLTDDDCRAIREAIGQPAMSFDRVRAMVAGIERAGFLVMRKRSIHPHWGDAPAASPDP